MLFVFACLQGCTETLHCRTLYFDTKSCTAFQPYPAQHSYSPPIVQTIVESTACLYAWQPVMTETLSEFTLAQSQHSGPSQPQSNKCTCCWPCHQCQHAAMSNLHSGFSHCSLLQLALFGQNLHMHSGAFLLYNKSCPALPRQVTLSARLGGTQQRLLCSRLNNSERAGFGQGSSASFTLLHCHCLVELQHIFFGRMQTIDWR